MTILRIRPVLGVFSLLVLLIGAGGCSVAESKTSVPDEPAKPTVEKKGASIEIKPNSPADIVRTFYSRLREGKFREAIYLTNLRPAIEGLSDDELKDFQVDLESIARHVPAEIEINGEIISGDSATVTAKLPNDYLEKELQQIRLRKGENGWVILTVDEAAENRMKQEGKNYLRNLRIETHQDEARQMLNRIAKAQIAHAAQNGGKFGELRALVDARLLPSDVLSAESTGYAYAVVITENGMKYYATATPAEYGRSGVNSFLVRLSEKGSPLLTSMDTGGKPLAN
ncbi:MAG: hypothetical protein AB7F88_08430 [Pyrinomonadaceae bacterium]